MIHITDNTDDDHLTLTGGTPHIRPGTSVVEVGMEKVREIPRVLPE